MNSSSETKSSISGIEQTLTCYFNALYNGDCETLKTLFDKKARIQGFYEKEVIHQCVTEYLGFIGNLSSPAMLGEDFEMEILSINADGPIASCKVSYLFEALKYYEFLSLVQIGDEWRIISKIFKHESTNED